MLINDGHKHIQAYNSGLKRIQCINCGHTAKEINDALPQNVVAPASPPVAAFPSPILSVSRPATAGSAMKELGVGDDERKIFVEVIKGKTGEEVEVTFTGMWDGRFLKAAIRAIEFKYKSLKHNMTRKAVQENAQKVYAQVAAKLVNKGA